MKNFCIAEGFAANPRKRPALLVYRSEIVPNPISDWSIYLTDLRPV